MSRENLILLKFFKKKHFIFNEIRLIPKNKYKSYLKFRKKLEKQQNNMTIK